MAEIKQLQMDGVDILPVTHESAVVDNSGTTIANKYQPKSDSSLTTSNKTVTGAINEINNNKLEIGDQKSTVGSIKVRYVKYNGENFYPMTHTDAILDANGNVLSTTLSTLMTSINTTIPNKLTTIETNVSSLTTSVNSLSTTATTLTNSVGTLSSLNTGTKTNLVAAINEVFQLGNNAKTRLVAALIAKGCEEITTSSTLEDVLVHLEKKALVDNSQGWHVEQSDISIDSSYAQYGFIEVGSGTTWGSSHYWESNNKGIGDSAALCKLFVNTGGKTATLYYVNSGESGYDYGTVFARNVDPTQDYSTLLDCYSLSSSTTWRTISMGTASGFYYVAYQKDGSVNSGNDSFKFYVTFS